MSTSTLSRLTTYDDYRHLPDDGKQHQIIGGELFMTPAPSPYHQEISLNLASILNNYVKQYRAGNVYTAPIDVILSMTDVVQPDLVYVSKERLNIITKKNIVDAPDLVVEILSESTETIDRQKKMALYEKHGVKEYWIADPVEKTIEQYLLKDNVLQLQLAAGVSNNLSSVVIEGLAFPVEKVFG